MRSESDTVSNLPIERIQQGSNELTAYDPHGNTYVPDDEIDLRELWRIITKYKGTIFTVMFLVVATTVIATLLMRPVYRAQAMLEIKPDGGRVVKFQNLEQNDLQPLEYKTTQQNILRSDSVAEAVIAELGLETDLEMTGKVTQRGFVSGIQQVVRPIKALLNKDESAEPDSLTENRERIELLERFSERLVVSPIKRSDLFRVSFDSFDPNMSAAVANSVVEQYIRLNQGRRFGSTSGAKEFLQKEIARVQAKLETSEQDLTDFARANQIIDVEERDDIMTTRLSELNSQLTAVNGERVTAEAEYNQSRSGTGIDSLPLVLQNELVQQLKTEYSDLQKEYFRLSKIYKPAYPELQQIKAGMDRVEATISLEKQRIVSGMRANYEQLLNKEKLLEQSLEQQKQDLLALKDRSIQYNILKREWESNRQLYSGLLERMKEVGVAAGMEVDNVSVIDKAKVPVDHHKPDLKLNTLLAAALGLAGGVGLAFLLAFLDNTVRNPEELEKLVGISSLGMIPKLGSGKKLAKGSWAKSAEGNASLGLIAHFERDNDVSEAFRSARTSLMFSSPSGLPKLLQVTSTSPSEGKTTVASNLAVVLADNGARVLLVDADLRKPRVHKVFKIPSAPGLTECLTGQVTSLPARKTVLDNLFVVASGTPPPNPAELLGSKKMDEFLLEQSANFDHIIIDSAPLLGLADSVIIATKVEGLIYTVLAGEINKDGLKEGIKRLRRVHAPILGAILNQVEFGSGDYGYYGDNYYDYGSPYTGESEKLRNVS